MGYHTSFEIRPLTGGFTEEESTDLEELGFNVLKMAGFMQAKWYEWETDMIYLSEKHPNTVFVLSGEGESGHDLWRYWFKNGKQQGAEAVIVYPTFDEEVFK